jgi:hypothetical protein
MPLIPTGFRIKPLVGAVDIQQRIARYLPMQRFIQLLDQRALWFTRVLRWRDGDVCEASILPAYREYLRSTLKAEPEYLHMKSLMEFQLRANLGCCFSMFDGAENDLMWRSYAPAPDYGVIIVIRANALNSAVAALGGRHYLARVKYLTDQKARSMRVRDCPHFRDKGGQRTWDVSECTFFKRDGFESEREVRCVISADESWTILLHQFLNEHGIPELPPGTATPTDQPHVRIDMRDSMHIVSPRDRVAFITVPQMQAFTHKVETECESYLDTSPSPATSKGIYVPFHVNELEEIIVHPKVVAIGATARDSFISALERVGLRTRVRNSRLYTSAW